MASTSRQVSQKSMYSVDRYRNSSYLDTLSEEEQMAHIYGSYKSEASSTIHHGHQHDDDDDDADEITSQSTALSFTSAGRLHQNWRQIKLYICFKSVVWLFVGIGICFVNVWHQHELIAGSNHNESPPQHFCCECYHYAQTQARQRIDYSYCAKCVDCMRCKAANYTTTDSTFFDDATCNGAKGVFPQHSRDGECRRDGQWISTTSMHFFYKNYNSYGISALVLCLTYIMASLSLLAFEKSPVYVDTIGVLLLIYNIVVSMCCFYMVFKPFQYQRFTLPEYKGEKDAAYCYEDTLNEWMEDALTGFIYMSMGLLALQWLFCCCMYWTKKKRNEKYNCLTSGFERYYIYVTVLCGMGFFVTMLVAVAWLISTVVRDYHEDQYYDNNIFWLFVIDFMLLCSVVDIFCCPFCRTRLVFCCKSRYRTWAYRLRPRDESTSKYKKYEEMTNFDSTVKETLLTAQTFEVLKPSRDGYPNVAEDVRL